MEMTVMIATVRLFSIVQLLVGLMKVDGQPNVYLSHSVVGLGDTVNITCNITALSPGDFYEISPPWTSIACSDDCQWFGSPTCNKPRLSFACDTNPNPTSVVVTINGVTSDDLGTWKCQYGIHDRFGTLQDKDNRNCNETKLPKPDNLDDEELKLGSSVTTFSYNFNCSYEQPYDMEFTWQLDNEDITTEGPSRYSTLQLDQTVLKKDGVTRELKCTGSAPGGSDAGCTKAFNVTWDVPESQSNTRAIVGGVVGGVAGVAVIAFVSVLVYCCCCKKKPEKENQNATEEEKAGEHTNAAATKQ